MLYFFLLNVTVVVEIIALALLVASRPLLMRTYVSMTTVPH